MMHRWLVRVSGIGLCAIGAQGACSPSSPEDPKCGPPHPTFRLEVEAEGEPVPEDMVIYVKHGGGEDSFQVAGGEPSKMLFCKAHRDGSGDGIGGDGGDGVGFHAGDGGNAGHDAGDNDGEDGGDGGDGGGVEGIGHDPIRSVTCDLWTGAAEVVVTAQGFENYEQPLEAERDPKCGLILTEVHITLVRLKS